MSDMAEFEELIESVAREGRLVGRFLDAVGAASRHDGVTQEEVLSAARRFAALVEKSAEADVIGYREISELTGVKESTLRVWRTRGKLPPPDLQPNAHSPLWKRSTIDRWWKEKK